MQNSALVVRIKRAIEREIEKRSAENCSVIMRQCTNSVLVKVEIIWYRVRLSGNMTSNN